MRSQIMRAEIGFHLDDSRGFFQVVNAPFTMVAEPAGPVLPLWRQPETLDLARSLAPWVALPLVALFILLGLVRPALRAARQPPVRLLDATVQDAIPLGSPPPPLQMAEGGPALLPTAEAAAMHAREAQLEGIRQLARQSPATVANVVRNWVNQPG